MTAPIEEPEQRLDQEPAPHLSHSRINRYLTCPEQYRLYYVEKLRPKIESAGPVFGVVIHAAIADLFRTGEDPVEHFAHDWQNLKDVELRYKKRESWEDFNAKGEKLLTKFLVEEAPKIRQARGMERKFELRVTALDAPFVGIIDLVGQVDDRLTVIDFKTAGSDYEDHEAALSDQLTAYALAEPEAQQVALCVLVKTKERASNGTSPKEARTRWPNTSKRSGSFRTTLPPGSSTSAPEGNAPPVISCRCASGTRRKPKRPW